MDLNILKKELSKRLTLFENVDDVKTFIQSKYGDITNKNYDQVRKNMIEYMDNNFKNACNRITKEVYLYRINYNNYHTNIVSKNYEENATKTAIISGIGGVFVASTIGAGLMAIPLIAAFAFIGFLGANAYKNSKLAEDILKAHNETSKKLQAYFEKEIDNIIELQQKSSFLKKFLRKHLTYEQKQIYDFLVKRNITELVHFTNIDNYNNIMKYGILSRDELVRRGIFAKINDTNRYDNQMNMISLSITKTNRFVLNAFKRNNPNAKFKIIRIDASILFLENNYRIYCVTNAANHYAHKGSKIQDLEKMFDYKVEYSLSNGSYRTSDRINKAINETTDEQAEILFEGYIPTKYIIKD